VDVAFRVEVGEGASEARGKVGALEKRVVVGDTAEFVKFFLEG